jgi:hypothetical protein
MKDHFIRIGIFIKILLLSFLLVQLNQQWQSPFNKIVLRLSKKSAVGATSKPFNKSDLMFLSIAIFGCYTV